jgi:hypothetical protein
MVSLNKNLKYCSKCHTGVMLITDWIPEAGLDFHIFEYECNRCSFKEYRHLSRINSGINTPEAKKNLDKKMAIK